MCNCCCLHPHLQPLSHMQRGSHILHLLALIVSVFCCKTSCRPERRKRERERENQDDECLRKVQAKGEAGLSLLFLSHVPVLLFYFSALLICSADPADARLNWSPLLFLKIAFRILRPNNCTTSSPGREMIGSAVRMRDRGVGNMRRRAEERRRG